MSDSPLFEFMNCASRAHGRELLLDTRLTLQWSRSLLCTWNCRVTYL